ncbi:nucleoside ABC transporter membrane protein [Bellilinea caldifistulae]|uniref:ABC transporter permease n=1 Tax=Bellilinea caldifistulae TaxID=360411 RepID=A0A0P6XT74_9CHLR|nr:ABC transporter permease [Bellilinea caldifistulae]KPL76280.1 ABC transporter permease [Bellilinea caldifistulae]GAP11945.1 nucleoside ABC transporter membrane protein [Bellilinea caldifistulae]
MKILIGLINGMISGATPILLAALGGAYTYYAGVFNIAMEGMLLTGAFFAVLGSYYTGSWLIGVLLAILGALFLSLIFILFAVVLKTDEFVTGIALNLFAVGATTYMLRKIFSVKGVFSNPAIQPIPAIRLPLAENIPFVGEILSGQILMVWVAGLATILTYFLIFQTRFGLRLRAAGYNPARLDSSGVPSSRMRALSLLACGVLCGLGGSFLSLGYVNLFAENMSAGRGWISLAAIILVNGNPLGIALISLLFGFSDGLGLLLQGYRVPSQFTAMVPYIATLIALYFYAARKRRLNSA